VESIYLARLMITSKVSFVRISSNQTGLNWIPPKYKFRAPPASSMQRFRNIEGMVTDPSGCAI
jgi:hypothetical protein